MKKTPAHVTELYLQPGEVLFGDHNTRIRTILGSCVAVTIWNPKLLIGGMCHYMLASRKSINNHPLDGRYANEALDILLERVTRLGLHPSEFHAKIFGGGSMFSYTKNDNNNRSDVSMKNIESGCTLVKEHGFSLKATHVGGEGHRQVVFDIWSGDVWMRQTPLPSDSASYLRVK